MMETKKSEYVIGDWVECASNEDLDRFWSGYIIGFALGGDVFWAATECGLGRLLFTCNIIISEKTDRRAALEFRRRFVSAFAGVTLDSDGMYVKIDPIKEDNEPREVENG